jgi:hypothetical protein
MIATIEIVLTEAGPAVLLTRDPEHNQPKMRVTLSVAEVRLAAVALREYAFGLTPPEVPPIP